MTSDYGNKEDSSGKEAGAYSNKDEKKKTIQDLERVLALDPSNRAVRKKLDIIRTSVRVDELADNVRIALTSGNVPDAVKRIREIFDLQPSAPVLQELLSLVESADGAAIEKREPEDDIAEIVDLPEETEYKDDLSEDIEEIEISDESDLSVDTVIEDDVTFEADVKTDESKSTEAKELPPPGKKRSILPKLLAGLVILCIGYLAVEYIPQLLERPEMDIPIPAYPYDKELIVKGPSEYEIRCDGAIVQKDSLGKYCITGEGNENRSIRVEADGFEIYVKTITFISGHSTVDTISMQPLGTSEVEVRFTIEMPEGEPQPDRGSFLFLVDGVEQESPVARVKTGLHEFQVLVDGYESNSESVSIRQAVDFVQPLLVMGYNQARIDLSLSPETPGSAGFYIDGEHVGSGRSVSVVRDIGTHSLWVGMDGRESWRAEINLQSQNYRRTITLIELIPNGKLVVGPEPWADVYINDELHGRTPFRGINLEQGTYTIKFVNPDFETDIQTIEIRPNETTAVRFNAVQKGTGGVVSVANAEPDVIFEVEAQPEPVLIPPELIRRIEPVLSPQARSRGDLHGIVKVSVTVGIDGSVIDADVISNLLGLGCGRAAEEAVLEWTFRPATLDGEPTEYTYEEQIRFDID